MKITKITRLITNNFWVKILSILIALGFWVFVGIGQTKSAIFPGDVPLQIKNVPQGLVAVTDTEKVKVKVVASANVFNKLSIDSFDVFLDLNGLKEGTYEVKIMAQSNVNDLQVVETNPQIVVVRLEPSIEKELPVKVSISGNAGSGLVAGLPTATPDRVRVSGAKSIVNSLLEATAQVTLEGQTADFQKVVKLVGLNGQSKEIRTLSFTPATINVNVPIVKASNVKTVGIKVNLSGAAKDGFWVSKIETDPKTVTITASEETINKINFIETENVDIDGIYKNDTLETQLKPINGVTILENPGKVMVNLYVSKSQSSREIEVGYEWQGLADNLKVSSVDPVKVKVVVSGPQDLLDNLTSSDITIIVDLSGRNAAGTYSVDLNRDNVSAPSGVSITSIVPSAINVRLDTK